MKNGDLRDLVLAGVRWELREAQFPTSEELKEKSEELDSADKTHHSTLITHHSGAIAPIAPVSAPDVAGVNDTQSLVRAISDFNHPLKQFAKNTVLPRLTTDDRRLLIITDSPSADDDESGQVLSGAAGALMDKMLAAIGLSRADVSILPMVFWRTAGGTSPSKNDLDLARPFVNRAIELLRPAAILTLGTLAASEIANAKLPADHGKQLSVTSDQLSVPVIPIFHPNYILLKPDTKKVVWEALQKLQRLLIVDC
jgi:DNA polymerase